MALLLYGALVYQISDWDVGVTLLMGTLTYLSAPWCVRTLLISLRDRPRGWPLQVLAALFVAWSVVDGDYTAYHTALGHQMFRRENALASTPLYFLAGFAWLYRGSLRELLAELRALQRGAP